MKRIFSFIFAICLIGLPLQAEPRLNTSELTNVDAEDYLAASAYQLLKSSAFCPSKAPERFFEVSGDNYLLYLGTGYVEVIGRKTWGAGPVIPEGRSWKSYSPQSSVCSWFQKITVHHTHSLYTIQSLQTFHQTQKDPKADIGYHFFIDQDGLVYEARPLAYLGSHSESDNSQNVGIVLNGDFTEKSPTSAQLKSLKQLIQALHCPCSAPLGLWTHQMRKSVAFPGEAGHYTACPGQFLAVEVYQFGKDLGFTPVKRP